MKKLKRMKGLCMMFFALGLSLPSVAQVTNVSFATGTTNTTILPVYGNMGFSYSQQIYLASEIGVFSSPQMINKIRFYYVSGAITNSNNWTIYMGNTALASFAGQTATDWVPTSGMQQVYTGTRPTPTVGWNEIVLTTPFIWDGTSNLVVAVDENQSGWGNMTWRKHDTGANRSMSANSDSDNPNPEAPPAGTSRYSYVPQTQFNLIAASDCSGTPAHYLTTATNDTICEGTSVTLGVNDNDASLGVSGLTLQWESRQADTDPWLPIADATSKTYVTGPMTTTTEYRLVFTCTASGLQDAAESVKVRVFTIPTVVVSPTSYAICNEDTTQLIASGADFFTWSPAAGLNSTNSDLVDAYPSVTTVYTVTGTTAVGCSSTATTTVYKVDELKPEASFSPAVNCGPGTPVSMTINTSQLPTGISNNGTWQYRFLREDGTTVAQDWNTVSSYTFTPLEDSVYSYFYQIRSTSCPESVDSTKISISVGFGADAEVIHYDCNNLEGTITLENIFGQAEVTQVYTNPGMATTADVVTTGNASITDGRLVLTPSVLSNQGSGTINIPGFAAGVNNAMEVSFKLTADQPANVGADGLSYSFGNDATTAAPGPLQNGKGTKLRLSFDAIDNSGDNGNLKGIYLVYGYTGGNAFGPASAGVLGYSTNSSSWMYKTDVPVRMSIDVFGRVKVYVDTVLIFNNIQLPA